MIVIRPRFRDRIYVVLRACVVAFVMVLSTVMFTPLVKWIAESMDQDWFDGNADVLIVLAGSMLVPGNGADATLGYDTYLRCTYAVWTLEKHTFRTIIVTGGDGAAPAMRRFLETHGVPAHSILIEDRATSTFENALYSKQLLAQRYGGTQLPNVVVLTSDFHSWRALHVFRRIGLRSNVIPVPDIIKRSSSMPERWPLFLLEIDELGKDVLYTFTGRL